MEHIKLIATVINLIKTLLMALVRFPFITIFVVFRIHWQALKLWLKGAPFFTHPNKLKREHISEG